MGGMSVSNITRTSDAFDDMSDDDWLDAILNDIVQNTPVDTGECAAGWDISGNDIYNDVDYTSYLEDGHSSQAPSGFIQQALDDWGAEADVSEI